MGQNWAKYGGKWWEKSKFGLKWAGEGEKTGQNGEKTGQNGNLRQDKVANGPK